MTIVRRSRGVVPRRASRAGGEGRRELAHASRRDHPEGAEPAVEHLDRAAPVSSRTTAPSSDLPFGSFPRPHGVRRSTSPRSRRTRRTSSSRASSPSCASISRSATSASTTWSCSSTSSTSTRRATDPTRTSARCCSTSRSAAAISASCSSARSSSARRCTAASSATRARRSTDAWTRDELATPGYAVLSPAIKTKLATLEKGQLMVRHPHFTQPIFVRFPRPAVMRGRDGAEQYPAGARTSTCDAAVLRSLRTLDPSLTLGWVQDVVALASGGRGDCARATRRCASDRRCARVLPRAVPLVAVAAPRAPKATPIRSAPARRSVRILAMRAAAFLRARGARAGRVRRRQTACCCACSRASATRCARASSSRRKMSQARRSPRAKPRPSGRHELLDSLADDRAVRATGTRLHRCLAVTDSVAILR